MHKPVKVFASIVMVSTLTWASGVADAHVAVPTETPASKTFASVPVPSDEVHKGDTGNKVIAIQYVLKVFGYSVNIDGTFGDQTETAIKHFQKVNNLWNKTCQCWDGTVGPLTAKALGVDLRSTPQPPKQGKVVIRPVKPASSPSPVVVPDPPAPQFNGDVPQLIRDIWPDDSENWAVAIAHRESNFVPTARNACCYGLFQIHFAANHAVLVELGITSPSQLLDAETNIRAALVIFQRSGNSPWLCHGQCIDIPL